MDEVLLDLVLMRLVEGRLQKKGESLLLAACDDDAALSIELSGEGRASSPLRGDPAAGAPAASRRRTAQRPGTCPGDASAGNRPEDRRQRHRALALSPGPGQCGRSRIRCGHRQPGHSYWVFAPARRENPDSPRAAP